MTFPRTLIPAPLRRRHESGQAMVEFALVVPILLLIVFAVVEFGMTYWTYQQLSGATSEGARRAAVSRLRSDRETLVTDAVKNASPNLNHSNITVTITSSWDAGDQVTVRTSYPDNVKIMGVTLFAGPLVSERTSRIEQ